MNRQARIGIGLVALLGAFTFAMLVIGSIGEPREELQRLAVSQVLAEESPADLYGDRELRIVGWYASLDGDCVEPPGPPASTVAWLEHRCPLRVLMPAQPGEDVSQAELEEPRPAPVGADRRAVPVPLRARRSEPAAGAAGLCRAFR